MYPTPHRLYTPCLLCTSALTHARVWETQETLSPEHTHFPALLQAYVAVCITLAVRPSIIFNAFLLLTLP